ncbi:hypothetical protein IQ03_03072 [Gemmobacter caeni]|uniref:O-antigen ligase-like membrane protein n=2 Tax=Gemmobacter TaxID=204456 RepID=A0A2T6AVR6_9RHOB|nr:hypothetical protein [Gemmobacter caeni]PTX47903.1 hypothetical protein C8N34_11156 [Gemmobacter caeni]TWI97375.1 hypothetical protein IQ03_03072 [Gemmobacter caeni]
MLLIWPLVVAVLWRRLPPDRALIWSILGAYLILPPVIALDLPVVPDLGKDSIPPLMAAVMVLFVRRETIPILPDSWIGRGLLVIFVLSPFATVLTNGEPLPKGAGEMIQGMRIYDSAAAVINQGIAVLPYFLARRYLGTPEAMRAILAALVAAGLAYSVPMLIETRLSPQMNVWVYGYFQHDFFQTIRFGGYRPVVFLPHGLWVAFFALMAALSAVTLFRVGPSDRRPRQFAVMLYLLAVLVLCKSAGPLVYALGLSPLILFAPRHWQVVMAALLAGIVITYPLLRGAHLVPLNQIIAFAEHLSPDRAYSFAFRVRNEEALLDRAALKAWFGWGGYGRNLIYDPVTGAGTSIADGAWIITLGIYGWLGYLAQFGLLVLPLLLMGREMLSRRSAVSPWVAAVCLLVAANLVDMLPNATLVPLTWMMAGAVLGHAEGLARARRAARAAAVRARWHPKAGRTVL